MEEEILRYFILIFWANGGLIESTVFFSLMLRKQLLLLSKLTSKL